LQKAGLVIKYIIGLLHFNWVARIPVARKRSNQSIHSLFGIRMFYTKMPASSTTSKMRSQMKCIAVFSAAAVTAVTVCSDSDKPSPDSSEQATVVSSAIPTVWMPESFESGWEAVQKIEQLPIVAQDKLQQSLRACAHFQKSSCFKHLFDVVTQRAELCKLVGNPTQEVIARVNTMTVWMEHWFREIHKNPLQGNYGKKVKEIVNIDWFYRGTSTSMTLVHDHMDRIRDIIPQDFQASFDGLRGRLDEWQENNNPFKNKLYEDLFEEGEASNAADLKQIHMDVIQWLERLSGNNKVAEQLYGPFDDEGNRYPFNKL